MSTKNDNTFDMDTLTNAIEKIIDKKLNEIKLEIGQLSHQVQMIKTQQNGPNTFFEALSPAAVIGAPKKFVNPAYQE